MTTTFADLRNKQSKERFLAERKRLDGMYIRKYVKWTYTDNCGLVKEQYVYIRYDCIAFSDPPVFGTANSVLTEEEFFIKKLADEVYEYIEGGEK